MKRIQRRITAVILTAVTVPAAIAREPGTAYSFLDITSSARIYGLGGVNITTIDPGLGSADQNPALLGTEMSGQTALGYMRYLGDSNFASVAYTHSSGERASWQASIRYFGYGEMTRTDDTGQNLGSFSPKDMAFAGGYTHDLSPYLRGGFNVKFLYSSYEQYTALALATDLGINYYDPDRDLSLSAVIANLGGQIKRFDNAYNRLPVDVRLGWSQSFGTLPVRFSVTLWNLTEWHLPYYETGDGSTDSEPVLKDNFKSNLLRHIIFGADFVPSEKCYVSLGYNYKTRTDMSTYSRDILSGWSLGAGLNVTGFRLGLALSRPHTGATTMMIDLTVNINDIIY